MGDSRSTPLAEGVVYDVISIELGMYRLMTWDEDALFPPDLFDVVCPSPTPARFDGARFETFDREGYSYACGSCLLWRPDAERWWRCEVHDSIPLTIWEVELDVDEEYGVCPDRKPRPLGPFPRIHSQGDA